MKDVVLLSTADWDNPFWTNKQHVAADLARRGHRVLYIDSLGLRRPSASTQDMTRILRRIRKAAVGPRLVRDNLWVWSPLVLPFQGSRAARGLNRFALSSQLAYHLRRLRFDEVALWTYNPMTTRLLATSRFRRVVYHCVDDIAAQPGMPADILAKIERELVEYADTVFATSPKLARTRKGWNPATHYLPNVADYDHFSRALDPQTEIPADLEAIPGPRAGFIGAISGYKLDFALIRRVAQSRPDLAVVLIGKVGEGDPWTDANALAGVPNVHLLGPRPYGELPAYLKGFDVALLPSARNDYTDSMFPMKFFEYLAAGCPVVSVDLPALEEFREVVALHDDPEGFIEAIDEALVGRVMPLEERLAVARRHTYAARTDRMLAILEGDNAGYLAPEDRPSQETYDGAMAIPAESRANGSNADLVTTGGGR